MNNTMQQNLITSSGRVLLSIIFIMAGFSKIGGYAGTQGYMESMGVPGMLLPLVILLELGGGLLLLAGWQTRIIAFLLAGFTLIAGLIFHTNFADQMQMILFMKNLAITGGLLFVVGFGPGQWSVDQRLAGAA
ncbi:MAG: DoxX family protein [Gammaproteobacteria bacterium]|nr:DoxX family protein [Gammaproteobacteria bacterium]